MAPVTRAAAKKAAEALANPPFQFLGLPAELRLLVYSFYHEDQEGVLVVSDHGKWSVLDELRHTFRLAHVNRQMRAEVFDHVFRTNTIYIVYRLLGRFFDVLPPLATDALTSMVITDFSLWVCPVPSWDYGFKIEFEKKRVSSKALTDEFPSLQELHVRFNLFSECFVPRDQRNRHNLPSGITAEEILKYQSARWLMDNRGLTKFELASTSFCFECMLVPEVVKAFEEANRRICDIVTMPRAMEADTTSKDATGNDVNGPYEE